ncbi:GreA/GreB family elongation factor [Vibrio rumoiensis]|uniref:GreA/GreB family elongation factor n=1 Tax=Vibrio rumoiensis TaxID=76258 RepID=UPI000306333B|nr:GreA/GreB family elongation factor [Vibrio rumoiensis]
MSSISIDKTMLHHVIVEKLTHLHSVALSATQTAIDTATDQENAPEHKYDTLSLEAAYLAHGQAQRLQQCAKDINTFKSLPIKHFSEEDLCSLGALIEVNDENDEHKWFFISPVAGGLRFDFNGILIQLVTSESPLGKGLVKSRVGDEFDMNIADHQKTYEIMTLL